VNDEGNTFHGPLEPGLVSHIPYEPPQPRVVIELSPHPSLQILAAAIDADTRHTVVKEASDEAMSQEPGPPSDKHSDLGLAHVELSVDDKQ
jgi:hypothetical protein